MPSFPFAQSGWKKWSSISSPNSSGFASIKRKWRIFKASSLNWAIQAAPDGIFIYSCIQWSAPNGILVYGCIQWSATDGILGKNLFSFQLLMVFWFSGFDQICCNFLRFVCTGLLKSDTKFETFKGVNLTWEVNNTKLKNYLQNCCVPLFCGYVSSPRIKIANKQISPNLELR